jgi:transcriptional regulator with XRE-family HTH domain
MLQELIRKTGVPETARLTGLDHSAVWRHLKGERRMIRVETLQRYARAFNVPLESLLMEIYPDPPPPTIAAGG